MPNFCKCLRHIGLRIFPEQIFPEREFLERIFLECSNKTYSSNIFFLKYTNSSKIIFCWIYNITSSINLRNNFILLYQNISKHYKFKSKFYYDSLAFFPGRAKFSRGGQKHTICLKTPKNILFSSKKVKKHTILAGQGGQRTPLALPCGRPCMIA